MATADDIATLRTLLLRVAGSGLRLYATAEPPVGSTEAPGQEYLATVTVKEADPTPPPPTPDPPPVSTETLKVVSSSGVRVRGSAGLSGTVVTGLGVGIAVVVDATYKQTVDNYVWRRIVQGTYAGKFVAQQSVSGDVYLVPQ